MPTLDKKIAAIRLNGLASVIWLSGAFGVLFFCLTIWAGAFMDEEFNNLEQFYEFVMEYGTIEVLRGFLKFTLFQLVVRVFFWLMVKLKFWKYSDTIRVN